MSGFAKKMLERYGWKEGEGLGRDKTGVKTYVKVVRRDPQAATGLGHAADPSQAGHLASTHAVELDAIYGQLRGRSDKRQREEKCSESDDEDLQNGQRATRRASSSSSESPASSRQKMDVPSTISEAKRGLSSSDDSSSDSDCGEGSKKKMAADGDVTRLSDAELFQRCGGVRLGRAGRHRFFDGKLERISKNT